MSALLGTDARTRSQVLHIEIFSPVENNHWLARILTASMRSSLRALFLFLFYFALF